MKLNKDSVINARMANLEITQEEIQEGLNAVYGGAPVYGNNIGLAQMRSLMTALTNLGYENLNGHGAYHIVSDIAPAEGETVHYVNGMNWIEGRHKNLKQMLEKVYVVLKKPDTDDSTKGFAKNIEMECIPGCISKLANFFEEASVNDGQSFLAAFKTSVIREYLQGHYETELRSLVDPVIQIDNQANHLRFPDVLDPQTMQINMGPAYQVHVISGIINRISGKFMINSSPDVMATILTVIDL